MIRKVYFYGDRAGEEIITDYDDFARGHVQDEDVALSCAEDILEYGESRNEAPHANVMEVYTATDREALERVVRERQAQREAS